MNHPVKIESKMKVLRMAVAILLVAYIGYFIGRGLAKIIMMELRKGVLWSQER